MKIVVGLGNPGKKYEKTRHNVGFLALDDFWQSLKKTGEKFSDFTFEKKYNAEISTGNISGDKIILVKPQTFMNESGNSINAIISFYKINPKKELLAIYDDIDLPLGSIRTTGESAGGHKGMDSVIKTLGTNQIMRIRIGILGKPKEKIYDTANYVLENFSENEYAIIEKTIKEIVVKKIEEFIKNKNLA